MNEQIQKESKLSLKWLCLAWLSLIFCSLIIGVIGAVVQGNPESFIQRLGVGIGVFAICLHAIGMIIAVVILYYLLKERGLNWNVVGVKGRLSWQAIGYVLVCMLIIFLIYPMIELSLGAGGVNMYWDGRGTYALLTSPLAVALILVNAVLICPVTEEIIFRGYILTMFIERMRKTLIPVLLSALIFTSIHIFFGPGMMVYIFLWAFIPAFLYLKFKSLYPAILFHFLNNLIAYIILPLLGV